MKPKAWLLDLDADTRDVVTTVLEHEGFVVLPFEFASDLLGLRAAEPPAIAVIDARTAQYHPRQICGALSPTGIIVMTMHEEDERVWAPLGVTRMLRKPFAADMLRTAVRAAMAQRGASA